MAELYMQPNSTRMPIPQNPLIASKNNITQEQKLLQEELNNFLSSAILKERQREQKYLNLMQQKIPSIFNQIKNVGDYDWKKFIAFVNIEQAQDLEKDFEAFEKMDIKEEELKQKINEYIKNNYVENSGETFKKIMDGSNVSDITYDNKYITFKIKTGDFVKANDSVKSLELFKSNVDDLIINLNEYIKIIDGFDFKKFNNSIFTKDTKKKDFYNLWEAYKQSRKSAGNFDMNTFQNKMKKHHFQNEHLILKQLDKYEQLLKAKMLAQSEENLTCRIKLSDFAEALGSKLVDINLDNNNNKDVYTSFTLMGNINRKTDGYGEISDKNMKGLAKQIYNNLHNTFTSGSSFSIKKESECFINSYNDFLNELNNPKAFLEKYLGIDISTKLFDKNGYYARNGIHMGSLGGNGKILSVAENLLEILNSSNITSLNTTTVDVATALLNSISNYVYDGENEILKYLTGAACICMFSTGNILAKQLCNNIINTPIESVDILHLFDIGGEIVPLSYVLASIQQSVNTLSANLNFDTKASLQFKQSKIVPIGHRKSYTASGFASNFERVIKVGAFRVPMDYYGTFYNTITVNLKMKLDMDKYLQEIANIFNF